MASVPWKASTLKSCSRCGRARVKWAVLAGANILWPSWRLWKYHRMALLPTHQVFQKRLACQGKAFGLHTRPQAAINEHYAEIGVRQSSEPEVPDTSWVQTILR